MISYYRYLLLYLFFQDVVFGRSTWLTGPNFQAMSNRRPPRGGSGRRQADLSLGELADWGNVTIRYKKTEICETAPGVSSYAGFADLDENSHTFFWFFEARKNPETAPITLWLNGGPGSDSLIGLLNGTSGFEKVKLAFHG
jgi:hypothetical protein